MPQLRFQSRVLHALVLFLAMTLFALGVGIRASAAPLETSIVPTVHPTLTPTSAIQAPLRLFGDQTWVWSSGNEQRMLLSGHVSVSLGYRLVSADSAAVWLTPSRESGTSIFEVAIYLSGNVTIREGNLKNSTTTAGTELLLTSRITQSIQLVSTPVPQAQENSPIFRRGDELRREVRDNALKLAPLHVPVIVVTDNERALQSGWIARGPNNRIIPGPGDLQVVRDGQGNIIPGGSLPAGALAAKPRPSAFITVENGHFIQSGAEILTIGTTAYILYDSRDGKPPLEFRAQRVVLFSPNPEAATQPATAAGTQTAPAPQLQPLTNDVSRLATGVYLEGDVTLDQGNQIMIRAERVFYDFTTQRAIMLDATLATIDEKRDVPVYLRASEIRQIQRGEFAAKKVTFSTSEFYTPHYHIGASEIYLRDMTPQFEGPGGTPAGPFDLGMGGNIQDKTFRFEAKDATINMLGQPIFWWPYLSGSTDQTDIPLKNLKISSSRAFGLSIVSDWDLFALTGQPAPAGVNATLNLDYYGKRGPGAGVVTDWKSDDARGLARIYAILDSGTDDLGRDREDVQPQEDTRGKFIFRDQRDLGDGITLQIEGGYISDPTFMEQFFQREFDTDKEPETSIYLKKQNETDALTFLGKFNLMDFTATADSIDSQMSTEKKPELKYWRLGDNFFDLLTYFSETSIANVSSNITDFTPNQLGLTRPFKKPNDDTIYYGNSFLGSPGAETPPDQRFRDYFEAMGYTSGDVLRADTRHEIHLPLMLGDLKVTPYAAGRITFWDQDFPENPPAGGADGGSTTRYWVGGGIRASTQMWRVYEDVHSTFFDVHRLRHVVEPQFHIFAGADSIDRAALQPFDRDVEGITGSSGMSLALRQKWQTKRGGEGHWRNVDWITLNVAWNQFWNQDEQDKGPFLPIVPSRGYFFMSRPELSLATSSITVDGTWRIGERVRFMGEANYSLDEHDLTQFALGLAIDQTSTLSYFIGNRYINRIPLYKPSEISGDPGTYSYFSSNQWTFAVDYQLTTKYELIAAQSYDFGEAENILTSFTVIRKLPRFNMGLTVTYDANEGDTSVSFVAWPQGFEELGIGNQTGSRVYRR